MSEEADMERPVTRRELNQQVDRLDSNIDLTRRELKLEADRLDGKIDRLDAKIDAVCGALLARMDAIVAEMRVEMGRQTKAAMEWALEQFRAVDDKYADLPRRVTRLEGKVFPPKRARRR